MTAIAFYPDDRHPAWTASDAEWRAWYRARWGIDPGPLGDDEPNAKALKYSEDQPRDESGKWTSGGGGGGAAVAESIEYTVSANGVPAIARLQADSNVGAAIADYCSDAYRSINQTARHHEGVDSRIARIDRAIAEAPALTKAVTVYRGVDPAALGLDADHMGGAVIKDEGFVSTSMSEDVGREFADMRRAAFGRPAVYLAISVPAGAHVLDVAQLSGQGESEVLLPRGGTFTIKSKTTLGQHGGLRFHRYRTEYTPAARTP